MSKKYIDFRVVGNDEELKSFTSLLQLIQSFGQYGMSRNIKVSVDGDGSGRLYFQIRTKSGKQNDLQSFQLDDLHQLEKTTENKYSVYIGE